MSDNWENVGRAVKQARRDRRWSIRDACAVAELSTTTWINAEKGMRVSELTQSGIARAFGWPNHTIDRLLAGDDIATATAEPNHNGHHSPDDESWDELKSSLSEEDRAAVRAIIESLKAKRST